MIAPVSVRGHTMHLNNYFQQQGHQIHYSRQQASDFAKQIAGDYNPIHDADAKMFCVPGDLLFATVLCQYGLSRKMTFRFQGMVTDDSMLDFAPSDADTLNILDQQGKSCLEVERSGEISHDQVMIEHLTRSYVEFSGKTFPHILVPLMSEHKVMINVSRPLVVYESMMLELENMAIQTPHLELDTATLDVQGKRGKACLQFLIIDNGQVVGKAQKNIVLSGLREFEQAQIDTLIDFYNERKQA